MIKSKTNTIGILPMDYILDIQDNLTGKYPDTATIALNEEWAKNLIYCDISGFAIDEEGQLLLIDDCNNIAYCPPNRFNVNVKVANSTFDELITSMRKMAYRLDKTKSQIQSTVQKINSLISDIEGDNDHTISYTESKIIKGLKEIKTQLV
jgi:hypothetical protein